MLNFVIKAVIPCNNKKKLETSQADWASRRPARRGCGQAQPARPAGLAGTGGLSGLTGMGIMKVMYDAPMR